MTQSHAEFVIPMVALAMFPPFFTSGESPLTGSESAFSECIRVQNDAAKEVNARIRGERFSLSKDWGYVLRSEFYRPSAGDRVIARFTCWISKDTGKSMYFMDSMIPG